MSSKWFIEKLKNVKLLTVEPFLFLFMFSQAVRFATFQDLLIDRSCRMSFSDAICNNLTHHDDVKKFAVKDANNIYTGFVVALTLPACLMSILLGPWSDIYGRRYTMILATVGTLINNVADVIITANVDCPPSLFIASAVTAAVTGGFIIAVSTAISYLSDITDERSRTVRLAFLEFSFLVASPLGSLIGGQVFKVGGYISVVAISPACVVCALLWLLFVVKESKTGLEAASLKKMFLDLFRFDNIRQSYRTCVAPRPGNCRLQIWLLIFVSVSVKMITIGAFGMMFSFVKQVYNWDVTYYSNISAFVSLYGALAALTIVPFIYQKFQLHEAALGLIGILSQMYTFVIMSVAFKVTIFFFGIIGEALHSAANIAIRSRLSKLVDKQELGRIFSLVATCDSVAPVLGTVIMGQIMNVSLHTFPGLIFAVGAVMLLPSAAIFVWMTDMPTVSFAAFGCNDAASTERELESIPQNK